MKELTLENIIKEYDESFDKKDIYNAVLTLVLHGFITREFFDDFLDKINEQKRNFERGRK